MLHHASFIFVASLAGVSLVSGANVADSVSSACKTALSAVLTSPDSACVNAGAFLTFALSPEQGIPAFTSTWLTGVCSAGSCPNSTIETMARNITQGCMGDISSFSGGWINVSEQDVVDYALQFYPTVREIACLKDDGANKLCVPQALSSLESVIGTLGQEDLQLDNLRTDITKLISSQYSNLACTACTKAAFGIAAKVFPFPDLLAKIQGPVSDTCGASFLDGTITGVSRTAAEGIFTSMKSSAATIGQAVVRCLTIVLAMLFLLA